MKTTNLWQFHAHKNNIMKKIHLKIFLMITIVINFIACKAQTLPLNTFMENIPNNAYVKDLDNELAPYVGVYKSHYQGNEITLYITKEDNRITKIVGKQFYQDTLVIRYIVKNSSGVVLQDTQNVNIPHIKLYSIRTMPQQNKINFVYSGTNCRVGWGDIDLSKISPTHIKWDYMPDSMLTDRCPPGTDINIYLPTTKGLIFTKQ